MTLFEQLPTIITLIFLLTILSYYLLIFIRQKKAKPEHKFSSITIIIPAHNEDKYIKETINSIIEADFNGKKQIIVVDDGSIDKTYEIASKFKPKGVKVIRIKHSGKSKSINKALSVTKSDLIAIVDGDSYIHKDALKLIAAELERKNVAAATGVVKVRNRNKFICMWIHIEQLYNSLMRLLFSKINANIVTPGPLSIYRRKEIMELGGFSTKGFSEDIDITIRLIRKGYKIGFAEKAVAETNMPYDAKGFLRQRTRFAKGILNIFKRHMRLKKTIIDLYTLPLFFFSYIQAIIMGSFIIYQIVSGYFTYFVSKAIYFNLTVLKFFFEWFSIVGFIKWFFGIFSGQTPLTFVTIIGIVSTLLSYPLFILAIIKFDKKFDLKHLIPIFFMFPFWLIIMVIYILMSPNYFRKRQYNIWKKNE
jgi:cellulose synthase/poly-beta-1,6-N-acetylglucosamine synthase-like glycosyltransferase